MRLNVKRAIKRFKNNPNLRGGIKSTFKNMKGNEKKKKEGISEDEDMEEGLADDEFLDDDLDNEDPEDEELEDEGF